MAVVWRKSNNLALVAYYIFLEDRLSLFIFLGKIKMTGTMDSVFFYDFTVVVTHVLIYQ